MAKDEEYKKRTISPDDDAREIYDSWTGHGEKAKNISEAIKLYDRMMKSSKEALGKVCTEEILKWLSDEGLKKDLLKGIFSNTDATVLGEVMKGFIKEHEENYHGSGTGKRKKRNG